MKIFIGQGIPAHAKFFDFKPVAVVATIVDTTLMILLPLLQGFGWGKEKAVRAVWAALLVLMAGRYCYTPG